MLPTPQMHGSSPPVKSDSRSPLPVGLAKRGSARFATSYLIPGCQSALLIIRLQCDGQKPSCSSCLRKGVRCVYDLDGDCRRVDQLRKKNTALIERCSGLEHLLTFLRSCNETEAAALLRRLRTDEDVTNYISFARNENIQSPMMGEHKARARQSTTAVGRAHHHGASGTWTPSSWGSPFERTASSTT